MTTREIAALAIFCALRLREGWRVGMESAFAAHVAVRDADELLARLSRPSPRGSGRQSDGPDTAKVAEERDGK